MNRKRIETRWLRHHEKQEWQKEAEKTMEEQRIDIDKMSVLQPPPPPNKKRSLRSL